MSVRPAVDGGRRRHDAFGGPTLDLPPQSGQQLLHVFRWFALKFHPFARHRMLEAEARRVQGLAPEHVQCVAGGLRQVCGLGAKAGAVEGVAEQRVGDMGQMDADLVGAPRLKAAG